MPQMERLIGVGRRIFNHHQSAIFGDGFKAKIGLFSHLKEHRGPEGGLDSDIEKTFDDIKFFHSIAVLHQIGANFLCSVFRALVRRLQEREHHNGEIAFKFLFGGGRHNGIGSHFSAVEILYRLSGGLSQNMIQRHK